MPAKRHLDPTHGFGTSLKGQVLLCGDRPAMRQRNHLAKLFKQSIMVYELLRGKCLGAHMRMQVLENKHHCFLQASRALFPTANLSSFKGPELINPHLALQDIICLPNSLCCVLEGRKNIVELLLHYHVLSKLVFLLSVISFSIFVCGSSDSHLKEMNCCPNVLLCYLSSPQHHSIMSSTVSGSSCWPINIIMYILVFCTRNIYECIQQMF